MAIDNGKSSILRVVIQVFTRDILIKLKIKVRKVEEEGKIGLGKFERCTQMIIRAKIYLKRLLIAKFTYSVFLGSPVFGLTAAETEAGATFVRVSQLGVMVKVILLFITRRPALLLERDSIKASLPSSVSHGRWAHRASVFNIHIVQV